MSKYSDNTGSGLRHLIFASLVQNMKQKLRIAQAEIEQQADTIQVSCNKFHLPLMNYTTV
jgi:hypothetical protein